VVLYPTWLRLISLTTNINTFNVGLGIAGSVSNSEQKYDKHAHSSYRVLIWLKFALHVETFVKVSLWGVYVLGILFPQSIRIKEKPSSGEEKAGEGEKAKGIEEVV
jgi:hypothetical protein